MRGMTIKKFFYLYLYLFTLKIYILKTIFSVSAKEAGSFLPELGGL